MRGSRLVGRHGSTISLLLYTWLLSLLGMFIRNRMENTRQLERMHALERRAENQRLGALMHDAVASTLTQALAVTRDALVSGEIPEAQARGLHLVSSNLATALDELRAIVLVLEGHAEMRDGGVAVRSLGHELGQAQETLSASGFSASVRATGEWQAVELPGQVVRLVLREAVANVIRHGQPSGFVHISAEVSDGFLSLAVLNQAPARVGGSPTPFGHGIRNLRQRVTGLEGDFEAGVSEGVWTLRATVPLTEMTRG